MVPVNDGHADRHIVLAWGHFFLGEQVNALRVAGIGLIVAGTVVLAMSGNVGIAE